MHCDSSCVGKIIKLLGPIACRMSGVRCPAVGVVTINHAHLLDRPLLVCLSVRTVCSKTAEGTNFKFGRRVRGDSPHMNPDKYFPQSGRGHGHVTP